MRRIVLFLILLSATAHAQIKIGNNPSSINSNALFELEATNKGLLLPRVALNATTNASPLSAHVVGMTVYNTATVGDVIPGYYYNDGSKWVRIASSSDFSNIYISDGTLSANRTVTQGANTLSFTSTATNGFSIDGTTFSVDAAN
ncbi:MAG: hypothetical protein RL264_1365, partial [Bacteroidota bacterium]